MYCPYFLLASRHSHGRTRGNVKEISEINFEIKNRILPAGYTTGDLTFRHRASSILGQAFPYSPENAFYIFNQQIYFII